MKFRLLFFPLIALALSGFSGSEARAERIVLNDPVTGYPCPIRFEKTGPATTTVGATIQYVIRIQNLSACTFTQLNVVDILPTGTAFVSATPTPSSTSGQQVAWFGRHLLPGEERFFTVNAEVGAATGRKLINRACVANQHLGPGWFCTQFKTKVYAPAEMPLE